MNNREGARIAAKSKSGQVGIFMFKEPEKRKKKFSYKSRSQGFSVRKVQTTSENAAGTAPKKAHSQTRLKDPGPPTKKDASKKPIKSNNNSAKTKSVKSRNINFVENNKLLQKKKSAETANTVTLTQDQLTKILQTFGGENASLKIENGDIKIEDLSNKQNEIETKLQTDENRNIQDSIDDTPSTENVANDIVSNQNNEESHVNHAGEGNMTHYKTEDVEHRTENVKNVLSPRFNLGDIGGSIGISGFNDKDDAARRRREWKEELDKQLAEKQKEKDRMKKLRLSGDSAGQWNPWGLSDSGGRGQKKVDNTTIPQVKNGVPEKTSNQNSKPEIAPSSTTMNQSYNQANTPAAMRSSFSFGNYSDENAAIKQKEKKAWLQELEKQRQEDKTRQTQQKKLRESVNTDESYWAKQVPAVKSSVSFQNTKDDTATGDEETTLARSVTSQSDPAGTTAPINSIISPRGDTKNTIITPRGHQRGQWTLTDPAEKERQDKARSKHLEHIEAVKAQVEEKQRIKREAIEKKRKEDKEEEEKLEKERENLQKQFEMEAQKQKQKELDALAKHQALVESMQQAYEESMRLKQEKRMRHLKNTSPVQTNQQHNEDPVTASPRVGGSHGPVRRTPPPAAVAIEDTASEATDVKHSNVNEQGVQTEFSSVPEDSVPRLNERDKSAGIEYKELRKERPKHHVRVETKVNKTEENNTHSTDNKEVEIKIKKRKNKISERPKWGVKSEPKKKVKASDKDLTVSKKQREERRKKRMQELLADQERHMPRPRTKTEVVRSRSQRESPAFTVLECPDEEIDKVFKYSRQGQKSQRDHTRQNDQNDHRETERVIPERQNEPPPEHLDDYSVTPPLQTGDFVPFLRTDERLDYDSIPVTPAEYLARRHRDADLEEESAQKQTQYHHKDPLFSPDIRKEGENRQKLILKQLSNLRQGLIMKQREMELGLSTTPLST
ncbi:coiled-coil domain-containing protein 66-like [Antedon mediterranea]|uniref:coiled-coil domain-containing protein 66-like n=1 Tax=Antedon mediterranea TaxID=105859 RepID=UPI003AF57166